MLELFRYFGIFLFGFISLFFVYSAFLSILRLQNPPKARQEPIKATPAESPKRVIVNWEEIHRDLRISRFKKEKALKSIEQPNGEFETTNVAIEVAIDPEVRVTEKEILLTFPNNTYPSITELIAVTPQYGQRLFEAGVLKNASLVAQEGKVPWEFVFRFFDDDVKKEMELRSILTRAGWLNKDEQTGNPVFPVIRFEGDDLIVDVTECILTKDKIENDTALALFSQLYAKNYRQVEKMDNNTFRVMHIRPRTDQVFKPRDMMLPNYEAWKTHILAPLVMKSREYKMEAVFMGEIQDPLVAQKTQSYTSIDNFVHMIVLGKTGSGKSTSLLSWAFTQAMMSKEFRPAGGRPDKWWFADGKNGGDFELPAKFLSQYPVAVNNIEFVNLIKNVWSEYMRRQSLFAEARKRGVPCRNIYEYRANVEWLERQYIVVDEFSVFIGEMDFNALVGEAGTLPNMLNRLMKEARSFGFTFVFASQRYLEEHFPTSIRGQLVTKMVHAIDATDTGNLDTGDLKGFGKGEYNMIVDGLFCPISGNGKIRSRMPYLGTTNDFKVLLEREFELQEHKEWDKDIIYNDGNLSDLSKADVPVLWRFIKKLFLQEQGFTAITLHEVNDSQVASRDLCISFQSPTGHKILFGILDNPKELNQYLYNGNKRNRKLIDEVQPDLILNFVLWDLKEKDEKEVQEWKEEGILPVNWIFYNQSRFMKKLREAFTDYENGNPNTSFLDIIIDIGTDYTVDEPAPLADEAWEKSIFKPHEAELLDEVKSGILKVEVKEMTIEDLIKSFEVRARVFDHEVRKILSKGEK